MLKMKIFRLLHTKIKMKNLYKNILPFNRDKIRQKFFKNYYKLNKIHIIIQQS